MEITPEQAEKSVSILEERVLNAPPRLRAIGECGLDFSRTGSNRRAREHQVEVFRRQVELARKTGLPLSIHCVKAHGPVLELLRERATPPSVMHAYSGSAQLARQLVASGHYISFAANLCIPGARKAVESARAVPRERLLIETDTPDQLPPARRPSSGEIVDNEPAFVVDVAEELARVRGLPLAEIAHQTFENGCRVFGVDAPAS